MKKIITVGILTLLVTIALTGCAKTAQPAVEQKTPEQKETTTQPPESETTYTLTGKYYSTSMFGGGFIFFTPDDYSTLPEGVKGETINSSNSKETLIMLNINPDEQEEKNCTDYHGTATIEITNLKQNIPTNPSEGKAWLAEITKVIQSTKPVCEVL